MLDCKCSKFLPLVRPAGPFRIAALPVIFKYYSTYISPKLQISALNQLTYGIAELKTVDDNYISRFIYIKKHIHPASISCGFQYPHRNAILRSSICKEFLFISRRFVFVPCFFYIQDTGTVLSRKIQHKVIYDRFIIKRNTESPDIRY